MTPDVERKLQELLASYIDRLNSGEELDPEQILTEQPVLGIEILEYLEDYISAAHPTDGFTRGVASEETQPLGTLGDYTLFRQIGRGGMGVVYEAWENSMDRAVALKVLPAGVAVDDRAFQRFMQEARTAGKLSHPNVVPVHAMGQVENTPYFAMEFVEGETLAQILARIKDAKPETETPFGPKDRQDFFVRLGAAFADVADGLQHAHSKGVTHRDIKPSNLILDREGRLRILDFGLARLEGQESLTLSGDFVGTPLYMSPEQARRKKIEVDHRTDVYSLGATMYEAICGRPPFRGKDHADTLSQIIERDPVEPRKVNLRVPNDLETIVLKCMRKDTADRYATSEALGQDLRRFVKGYPIEARPQSDWARFTRKLSRHKASVLVTSGFTVLALVATWLGYSGQLAEHARRTLEYKRGVLRAVVQLTAGQFSGQRKSRWSWQSIDLPPGLNLFPLLDDASTKSTRAASAELRQLADSSPEETSAHYHLARAYHILGAKEAALAELERVFAIDPDFVPARVLAREIDPAAVDPRTVRQPEDFEEGDWRRTWLSGHQARSRGAWPEAAEAYTKLSEVRPEPYIGMTIEAYLGRGVARLGLGEYERAQEDLSILVDRAPGCIEAVLLLAKAYLAAGSVDARRRGEQLLDELHETVSPGSRDEAVLWIALVYASLQEFESALEWAEKLEYVAPRERLRSHLYRHLRQFDESTRAARRAIRADPDSMEAHVQLGLSLLNELHSGRRRDAAVVLELAETSLRAIDLDGTNLRARSLFGVAWLCLILRTEETARRDEMFEMRRRMARAALAAGIVLSIAGNGESQDFFDDFADREIFDCSPVLWGPEASWSSGVYDASSGDLVVGASKSYDVTLPARPIFDDSVSIRAQLTIKPGSSGYVFFGTEGGAYEGEIKTAVGQEGFRIRLYTGDQRLEELASTPLPVDFDREADHLLQLDVHGDFVELRVWKPGEPFPEEPVLKVAETTYRSGNAGLGVGPRDNRPPQPSLATFRFFQASRSIITTDGTEGTTDDSDTPRDFLDDFEDEDLFDCSPVHWGPEAPWSSGIYDLTSGDLVVGSSTENDVTLPASAFFSEGASLRAQLTISPGSSPYIAFGTTTAGAYQGVVSTRAGQESLMIVLWDGVNPWTVLASSSLPFDFDPEADHIVQLDVHDGLVELRIWQPGEPFPEEPALSKIDMTHQAGNVVLGAALGDYSPPQKSLATFRYFQASTTMITSDGETPVVLFRRADCNDDGTVDISDPVFNLEFQFLGMHDPGCLAALDTNADGTMDISDPVYNLEHQFLGRPAPPAPYLGCGPESISPEENPLPCETQPTNCP